MRTARFAHRDTDFPSTKLPDGTRLCRFCKKPVPKAGRWRFYCSEKCETEVNVRCGWCLDAYVRARDHGICAECGLDCEALEDALSSLNNGGPFQLLRDGTYFAVNRPSREVRAPIYAALGLNRTWPGRLWQAHHKIPVHKGGGKCGLDNYVTLCWRCHKKAHGKPYPLLEVACK